MISCLNYTGEDIMYNSCPNTNIIVALVIFYYIIIYTHTHEYVYVNVST